MTVPKAATGGAGAARGKRRRWIIALVATALIILVSVVGTRAQKHVRHDPAFCTESCHVPKEGATEAWHTRGHPKTECQSCHTTPLGISFKLYWKKLAGSKELPKHSRADLNECVRCHQKSPAEWRLIEATEGHRSHRGLPKVDCFSCHAKNAHTREASSEKLCLECHDPARLHKLTEDAESCLSCHTFSISSHLKEKPRAMACAGCHADPSKVAQRSDGANDDLIKVVNAEAIHGGLDCKLCHSPHPRKKGQLPLAAQTAGSSDPEPHPGEPLAPDPTKSPCARCHQVQLIQESTEKNRAALEGHRKCDGCHEPHAQRKHALESCVKCHEKRVKGPTAPGEAPASALRHESCASCHLPHTWQADKTGCLECHKEQAASIQTKSPAAHNDCAKCHDVHGPPPKSNVCLSCHANTKSAHVLWAPGKHKECTSCHEPHAATASTARDSCVGCHTVPLAQMLRDGPKEHAQKGCLGCHGAHQSPKPAADLCGKCHADKSRAVVSAEPPKHRVCASCHQPHKFAIKDMGAACSTCHEKAMTSLTAHKGACKDCHSLHGPAQIQKAACFKCHTTVQAAFKPPAGNEKHNKCSSCHEPHRAAAGAQGQCGKCHDRQIAVAKSWPASTAHAGACKNCHEPHDVKTKKACSSCHQKQATSALGGKHHCAQCHAPHRATPATWWSRCNDCHQKQVTSAKAMGPKHSDCKSCHTPHRFDPPGCGSCHAGQKDKGLHGGKGHVDKCSACHNPHEKAEATRATCLTCHTKQQKHEPDAQKCQACHPFR